MFNSNFGADISVDARVFVTRIAAHITPHGNREPATLAGRRRIF